MAAALLADRRLLPILDGLDELPEHLHAKAVGEPRSTATGPDGEALVITVLDETYGRTAMIVAARYSSSEIRDAVVRRPMDLGSAEEYDCLATLIHERRHP